MMVRARTGARRTRRWLHACTSAGAHTVLRGRPSLTVARGRLTIGDRCAISSRPVVSHLVAGPSATLEIGDDVSIGHGAAIAAFERIRIGSRTRIAPFVIIMDTNFHGVAGDQSVHHDCRPVLIGSDCVIGSRVTITRGASIGDGAEILAGSVVSSAIPAGTCAAGALARVVGRAGQPGSRWDGAAAVLPLLVMDALGTAWVPGLDAVISEIPGWHPDESAGLLSAIERQFGVLVESTALTGCCLGDLAAAIDQSREEARALKGA